MKLLGIVAALALIAHPASAKEIDWKVCKTYMEGTGPNALHVVAHRAPTPLPLTDQEMNLILDVGADCHTLWQYGFACKRAEDVAAMVAIWVLPEGAAFQGDCRTGIMHALAATEVIEVSH